jgi:hypothetical protein
MNAKHGGVVVLWAWSLGCASSVQPGLANAPALSCAPLSSPTKSAFVPRVPRDDPFVLSWMEHYYVGWPCPPAHKKSAGAELVAWSPTDLSAAQCALP